MGSSCFSSAILLEAISSYCRNMYFNVFFQCLYCYCTNKTIVSNFPDRHHNLICAAPLTVKSGCGISPVSLPIPTGGTLGREK